MGMKIRRYQIAFLLLLLLFLTSHALAEATPLADFDYTLLGNRVLLQKYKGTGTTVCVAGTYEIDGNAYTVTIDTASAFCNNTKLTSVTLEGGIQFATTVDGVLHENSMKGLFQGCQGLQTVDLSAISTTGVTDMSYLFSNCLKLKAVDFSNFDTSSVTTLEWLLDRCQQLTSLTGYEAWDTSKVENIYKTFNRVTFDYSADKYHDTRLQKIDISQWDLSKVKNSGWCFQQCRVNAILLPDNLATISAGFFNHTAQLEGSSYTVPAGVKKIGYAHTFYDMGSNDLTELKVAEGNTHYKSVDGIIYSMDGTEMLGIPRSKAFENNTYIIPEGVTFLAELSFSRNNNIHTIVLPNTLEIRQVIPENDPQYIVFEDNGNLNGGNSLSVATYRYTGIKAYDVKPDNPRYAAKDGILYSKDMSKLIAVPVVYGQLITVPEGTVQWLPEAILEYSSWDATVKKWPGVIIPSTMLDIAQTQIDRLNRSVKAADSIFHIAVHTDNPVYYVDEEGLLQERLNVYDAQVSLDCTFFTYDGMEKHPVPAVTSANGTLLTEGTDYTVSYRNNINAGTGTVLIQGIGAYLGMTETSFTIQPQSISGASVYPLGQLTWTGEYQTQPYALDLPSGVTYTVHGDTAREVGIYCLTIMGTGNYSGVIHCLYEIAPDIDRLTGLNEDNVTQADLPALIEIRQMMENANLTLADAATRSRYAQIIVRCDELIAQLTWIPPQTGDNFSLPLYWSLLVLCLSGIIFINYRSKRLKQNE